MVENAGWYCGSKRISVTATCLHWKKITGLYILTIKIEIGSFCIIHLLKCVRNDWLSEKSPKLKFYNSNVGDFADVRAVDKSENPSILKCSPLTHSTHPTHVELQTCITHFQWSNGCLLETNEIFSMGSKFSIVGILLTSYLDSRGEEVRLRNLQCSVQEESSVTISPHLELFS